MCSTTLTEADTVRYQQIRVVPRNYLLLAPARDEVFLYLISGKEGVMVRQTEQRVAGSKQFASADQLFTYTFDSLPLERGGQLTPLTLAVETWGTLDAKGTNASLIAHALMANAHAHDVQRPT